MSDTDFIQDNVRAAQSGEEAAWNVLYQYYYPRLYAAALRMCDDIDDAKDAVQDTFIKAHLKVTQLKEVTAFGSWIKRILIRTCFRPAPLNKSKLYDRLPVESDSWWEDEFDKKLDQLSAQSRLYTVINHLPEMLRSALLLRYFSEFSSYKEIASILSIPVGTVRSRLSLAKTKLATQWHQYGDGDLKVFEESREWNHFYHALFSGMHHHDAYKNKLVGHLQKDVRLIVPFDKPATGKQFFEKLIIDDRKAGSWLTPSNVTSCGNVSVVETRHFNSPENPAHCPPRSVLVLYRDHEKVKRINFHFSPQ